MPGGILAFSASIILLISFIPVVVNAATSTSTTISDDKCPLLDCFNKGYYNFHGITREFYRDCPHTESGGFQGTHYEDSSLGYLDGDKRGWRCLNSGQCNTVDDTTVR